MGRLRRVAWGVLLAGLALYMGRLWLRDLRRLVGDAARAALGLIRGTGTGFATPLHPVGEAAVTLVVIAAWIVLVLAVVRRGPLGRLTLGGRLAPGALVIAVAGLAALAALAVATLVPALAGPPLVVIATVVAVAVAVAVAAGAAGRGVRGEASAADDVELDVEVDVRAGVAPGGIAAPLARLLRLGVTLISGAALALLVGVLARDAVHLAFYRPAPAGDELSFWWRASQVLHDLGWDRYLATFDSAGYAPGYPLVANALFGWLPNDLFEPAGRALPFVYGSLALALLLRGLTGAAARRGGRGGRDLLGPAGGLLFVVAYVLMFEGDWVHSLFFELWYGEAFAAVLTVLLFVLLDHARRSADDRGRLAPLALLGMGLGALAAISKPPLSFLLLPAILPTVLVAGVVLRPAGLRPAGRSLRPLLVTLAALAAGALAANLLWGAQLRAYGITATYALDPATLLAFHPQGSIGPLVRYFVTDYQPTWVAFGLVAGLALVADPRRFVPFVLVAAGMAASILVLYLGAWSDVEHESGARYLLHGLDGFTIFALAALTPAIRATLDRWLARLLALAGRVTRGSGAARPAGSP